MPIHTWDASRAGADAESGMGARKGWWGGHRERIAAIVAALGLLSLLGALLLTLLLPRAAPDTVTTTTPAPTTTTTMAPFILPQGASWSLITKAALGEKTRCLTRGKAGRAPHLDTCHHARVQAEDQRWAVAGGLIVGNRFGDCVAAVLEDSAVRLGTRPADGGPCTSRLLAAHHHPCTWEVDASAKRLLCVIQGVPSGSPSPPLLPFLSRDSMAGLCLASGGGGGAVKLRACEEPGLDERAHGWAPGPQPQIGTLRSPTLPLDTFSRVSV